MKREDSGKNAVMMENFATNTQINMVVDGCKVKLNFPSKSEGTAVSDVKRMMLGGAAKT